MNASVCLREGRRDPYVNRMRARILLIGLMMAATFVVEASPAFAYKEQSGVMATSTTPAWSCPSCHGSESGVASPTVGQVSKPTTWTWDTEAGTNVGSRKGPHGGYTTGTNKCAVCHELHGASATSNILLAEQTIADTCFTCHDGTGGGGVYGVILQRTGFDPAETSTTAMGGTAGGVHRIGWLNASNKVTVPGGNAATGGSLDTTFTGPGGSLTCTDCHSPHNAQTVLPFKGDRLRSSADTTTVIKTNRLLKKRPTKAAYAVTNYGSDWCQTCHRGSKAVLHHSVADSSTTGGSFYYDRVAKFVAYNSSVATFGPLGGDNLGYSMAFNVDEGAVPPPVNASLVTTFVTQGRPICQQCHEDARNVGDVAYLNSLWYIDSTEQFTASLDGSGTTSINQTSTLNATTGNPPFQNYPHESMNDGLLIERQDDLCLNCHHYPSP